MLRLYGKGPAPVAPGFMRDGCSGGKTPRILKNGWNISGFLYFKHFISLFVIPQPTPEQASCLGFKTIKPCNFRAKYRHGRHRKIA